MLKKLPLWAKIFIGMGLGILFGLISVWVEWETFTTDWVKPWGTIFLKLLKLIAVPLIFVSLVKGISSLTDITKLSRIGYKTIVIYLITTVFATTVGLAMVNIFKPPYFYINRSYSCKSRVYTSGKQTHKSFKKC